MSELDERVREALQPFAGIASPSDEDRRAAEQAVRAVLEPEDFEHSLRRRRRVHVDVHAILGWPGFLTVEELDFVVRPEQVG